MQDTDLEKHEESAKRELNRAVRLFNQWESLGLEPPQSVKDAMKDANRAHDMVHARRDGHRFVRFVTLFADLINWRYIQRGKL